MMFLTTSYIPFSIFTQQEQVFGVYFWEWFDETHQLKKKDLIVAVQIS